MMFTSAVLNFTVGVTLAILPAFGDSLGGAAVYGLLLGALGTGRLVGSASASYFEDVAYGRLKIATFLLSALLWLGSVYSLSLVLTVRLFGLAWVSDGIDGVMIETLNQKVFPSDLLGRVSAILSVVSLCATGGQIVHKNFSLTVYQGDRLHSHVTDRVTGRRVHRPANRNDNDDGAGRGRIRICGPLFRATAVFASASSGKQC